MSDYFEKLKDPRWQKKRLEIFQRDEFTCRKCGADDKTLQVHHRYYVSKRDPWDYPDICFETVCEDCHKKATEENSKSVCDWENFLVLIESHWAKRTDLLHPDLGILDFSIALKMISEEMVLKDFEMIQILSCLFSKQILDKGRLVQLIGELNSLAEQNSSNHNNLN